MSIPTLHKLGNSFDDRNMFLQVALGLISLSRRFKRLLARYGTAAPPPDDAPGDDVFVYVVLGLISCSQHLMQHSEATRARTTRRRPRRDTDERAADPVSAVRLRGLLR